MEMAYVIVVMIVVMVMIIIFLVRNKKEDMGGGSDVCVGGEAEGCGPFAGFYDSINKER